MKEYTAAFTPPINDFSPSAPGNQGRHLQGSGVPHMADDDAWRYGSGRGGR